MKNTIGNSVTVTIFGESHGTAIGAVIDGIASGICVDEDFIASQLSRRRPKDATSTSRREKDEFVINSGVFDGKTTGTPICITIPNADTHSADYGDMQYKCALRMPTMRQTAVITVVRITAAAVTSAEE